MRKLVVNCKPATQRSERALVFASLGCGLWVAFAACIAHAQATLALPPASLCEPDATCNRNPQAAAEMSSVAACGLRLHVASGSHRALPLSLRRAACGCALHRACTNDCWHPLRLAVRGCTLHLARATTMDHGCALRRAVAACTGLAQAPPGLGCALRLAACTLHLTRTESSRPWLRVAACGLHVALGTHISHRCPLFILMSTFMSWFPCKRGCERCTCRVRLHTV